MIKLKAIDMVARRFEFIANLPKDPNTEDVQEQARRLADSYPNEIIKDDLVEGLRHFVKFF